MTDSHDPAERAAARDRANRRGTSAIVRRARYVAECGDDGAVFRRSGIVVIAHVRGDADSKRRSNFRRAARGLRVILVGIGEPVIADDPRAVPTFDVYRCIAPPDDPGALRELLWHPEIMRWEFDAPARIGMTAAGSAGSADADRAKRIRVRPDMTREPPASRLESADVSDRFPTAGRIVGVPGSGRVKRKRPSPAVPRPTGYQSEMVGERPSLFSAWPRAVPAHPCPYVPPRD